MFLSISRKICESEMADFYFYVANHAPTHVCLKICRIFLIIVNKFKSNICENMCSSKSLYLKKIGFLLVFRKPWEFWTLVYIHFRKVFNYCTFCYYICSIYSAFALECQLSVVGSLFKNFYHCFCLSSPCHYCFSTCPLFSGVSLVSVLLFCAFRVLFMVCYFSLNWIVFPHSSFSAYLDDFA